MFVATSGLVNYFILRGGLVEVNKPLALSEINYRHLVIINNIVDGLRSRLSKLIWGQTH